LYRCVVGDQVKAIDGFSNKAVTVLFSSGGEDIPAPEVDRKARLTPIDAETLKYFLRRFSL
jgi:hypothetical protein